MIGGRFITTPWLGPTISCGRQMLKAQPLGRRLVADVVLLQPVEVLVLVAREPLAGRDGDRVEVHAVGLRALEQADVLEAGGAAASGSIRLRSIAKLVSICSRSLQPGTSPGFS